MAAKKNSFHVKHPGALTRKAKDAHETINQYAMQHKNDPGATGKQARLYLNVFKPAAQARKKK